MGKLKQVISVTEAGDGGEDVEVKLAVMAPSAKARNDAKLYSLRRFNEAVRAGVMVEKQLERHVRDMDLWGDADQKERDRLVRAILEGERKIKGGNLNKARAVAIQMSKDRAALQDLTSVFVDLKTRTAEALAEQDYFNHLVAGSTFYEDGRYEGKPYFTVDGLAPSVEVYEERSGEPAAYRAASKLHELLHGSLKDTLDELPENAFLKKFKFIDDEFHFVDKQGRRVDESGRRIDDEGYLVDGDGQRVDGEGRPLDGNGDYVVEFEPFTDDDGEVVDPDAQ